MQWFLIDAVEVNQVTRGIDAPASKAAQAAPRIHPVVISTWTPELCAAYAAQVKAESINRFRQQATELRRKADGWTGSHYWRAADRLEVTILVLQRSA
jgi:hypothetical protein